MSSRDERPPRVDEDDRPSRFHEEAIPEPEPEPVPAEVQDYLKLQGAWTCPYCNWHTENIEYENHICTGVPNPWNNWWHNPLSSSSTEEIDNYRQLVEQVFGHVGDEVYELLTGMPRHEPAEPRPPRVQFEKDGHTWEAEFDEHIIHTDGRKYPHEQRFKNLRRTCGMHDEEGNHIG